MPAVDKIVRAPETLTPKWSATRLMLHSSSLTPRTYGFAVRKSSQRALSSTSA